VIYYVDTYEPGWRRGQHHRGLCQRCHGQRRGAAGDGLLEIGADSTTQQQTKCFWVSGPDPWKCRCPRGPSRLLLIAGDDNVIPFYRLSDPTANEVQEAGEMPFYMRCAPTTAISLTIPMPTCPLPDDFGWKPGGVSWRPRLIG